MRNLTRPLIALGALLSFNVLAAEPMSVTLHKDPYCGCCTAYAEYLQENGFDVKMIDHNNMQPIKQQFGTAKAASCHTVEVGDYVVEGHVPVAAIERMLKEQPDIKGITLPGMPVNSPGMGPEKKGSLKILSLDHQGNVQDLYMHL